MNRVVTSFHWKFPLGKKYSREFYPLGFYPPREEIRGRWEFERKSRLMREEGGKVGRWSRIESGSGKFEAEEEGGCKRNENGRL